MLFAHHRELQAALLERFPDAARVLGEDDGAARAASIDEHMAGVLHRKRGVIGAVTDGRDPGGGSALDEVVRALRERSAGAGFQAAA